MNVFFSSAFKAALPIALLAALGIANSAEPTLPKEIPRSLPREFPTPTAVMASNGQITDAPNLNEMLQSSAALRHRGTNGEVALEVRVQDGIPKGPRLKRGGELSFRCLVVASEPFFVGNQSEPSVVELKRMSTDLRAKYGLDVEQLAICTHDKGRGDLKKLISLEGGADKAIFPQGRGPSGPFAYYLSISDQLLIFFYKASI